MGWRFVKQPNGLYARFSEVTDDFTDFNLTREECIQLYVDLVTRNARQDAEHKVAACEPLHAAHRWSEALIIVKRVHGDKHAQRAIDQVGPSQYAIDQSNKIGGAS